jgi:hypothetical protein
MSGSTSVFAPSALASGAEAPRPHGPALLRHSGARAAHCFLLQSNSQLS